MPLGSRHIWRTAGLHCEPNRDLTNRRERIKKPRRMPPAYAMMAAVSDDSRQRCIEFVAKGLPCSLHEANGGAVLESFEELAVSLEQGGAIPARYIRSRIKQFVGLAAESS